MKGSKPFFSVIIPTLNEEQYLPRLLENVRRQTFSGYEVIVVDGKSDDHTIAKAVEYKDRIPKLTIVTSDNQNVSFQRNIGAKKAKADYLVFFDADVQIPKNFFRKIHDNIRKHRYMFLCTYQSPDSENTKDWLIVTVGNISMEVGNLLDKPFVGGFNIILHKSVFQQIGGFDVKLTLSEDHDLAERCLKAGVRMKILHSPRLKMSLRRFRNEGYFTLLRKYAQASLYYILYGPMKKALFDYPMGGHIYKKSKNISPSTYYVRFERWLLKTVRQILDI